MHHESHQSGDALTLSGAGRRVDGSEWLARATPASILAQLAESRFLVVRAAFTTLDETRAFLRRLGPLNEAATRVAGAVMVDGRARDEAFRGSGALPLHTDGILTGVDVAVVGIWCEEWKEVVGGRTLVSDAASALAEVPAADRELLRRQGMEALAIDRTGYYREEFARGWTAFPALRAAPGRPGRPSFIESLHLGLPHAPGEPESWRVRVAGAPPPESERVLATLRALLLQPRFVYRHEWTAGDLLLLDNDAVLHGREEFTAVARRLANLQVLRSTAENPGADQCRDQ